MKRNTGTHTKKNTKFDKLISEGSILTEVLPFREKRSNNYRWCEESADYIQSLSAPMKNKDRIRRLRINYNLANGRGDEFIESESQFQVQKVEGQIVSSGTTPVRHAPKINQVFDAMIGEQMQASLKFTAVDTSGYSTTMRQKKRLELNQQFIQDTIIAPIEQQIAMQVMIENGITQQSQLSPDEQQDLHSDIQNRTKFRLVDDIDMFMAKDYKTPVETEVQKLVNWLMKACDIKYITDENFKNVIIAGAEIYRIHIRNGFPVVDIVDPICFWKHSSKNKLFIDESDIVAYRPNVTYSDILTWHGTELYQSKYKDRLLDVRRGFAIKNKQLDNIVSFPGHEIILQSQPPIHTPEGQNYAKALLTVFGGSNSTNIEYSHYCWKSFGKMLAITRQDKKTGQLSVFYVDENYEFNPSKGDVEEAVQIVPEIYQTTKIGNDIYVDKGPLPYQYRSRQNPFEVRMNYVGAMYNTLGGNSENVAPLDLGKFWQHKINMQMHKIDEADRKNHGSVLSFPVKALPTNTTWKEWMTFIKNEGIMLHNDTMEGMTANDLQSIRDIKMGVSNEIEARIPYLEFLTVQMSLSMGFNPSRLGLQNPNLPVSNNRQNIVQSTIQTEYIYRTHNKVIENMMNNLVNTAKITLKNNPVKASYVLDDMSVAELELDNDLLDIAEQNIYVNNSVEDQRIMERINSLAEPLLAAGQIDFEDSIKLGFSKNGADMINIAAQAQRKVQARMQQQQEMESKMAEQQTQMSMQLEQMRFEMEMQKQAAADQTKLIVATIAAQRDANSYDIDKSGLNDMFEQNQEDLKFKREELRENTALAKEKLDNDKMLGLKKAHADLIKARQKPKVSK